MVPFASAVYSCRDTLVFVVPLGAVLASLGSCKFTDSNDCDLVL